MDSTELHGWLGLASRNIVTEVRQGLPFTSFERLRQALQVSPGELARVLSISDRTLARRRKTGRLTTEESDRLVRVGRLYLLVLHIFEGNRELATRWLTSPKRILGDESPLQRADTYAGAREVEDLLYAIEYSMPA